MWQSAFLAMSVAIGESLDAALAALALDEHDDAKKNVSALAAALRSPIRESRARAMAEHLALVATELAAMETTWRA